MVEMIGMDHIHIHSDGKNEMDGPRTHTQSAAGSNTFAGVLEVIELDNNTLQRARSGFEEKRQKKEKRCWCCVMLAVPEVLVTNLCIAHRSDHHSSAM